MSYGVASVDRGRTRLNTAPPRVSPWRNVYTCARRPFRFASYGEGEGSGERPRANLF